MAGLRTTQWEELRKDSRRLEVEIDLKLVSFSKLGSTYSQRDTSPERSTVGASGHVFDTMALEIEKLLSKLRGVNEALNAYVSTLSSTQPTTALYHTLQRHNEILQDYTQEFNRTRSNIVAQRQREELLGQSKKDYRTSSALNRRTELYLKEHEHIRRTHESEYEFGGEWDSTDRLTDDAISIAIATKENLSHQRSMFSGTTGRVQAIANRFPLINSLVQKINIRKRRDSLILGGVIAVCIIILLLFALK